MLKDNVLALVLSIGTTLDQKYSRRAIQSGRPVGNTYDIMDSHAKAQTRRQRLHVKLRPGTCRFISIARGEEGQMPYLTKRPSSVTEKTAAK